VRLQEEANGCLVGKWWLQNEEEDRMGVIVVSEVGGTDSWLLGKKNQEV